MKILPLLSCSLIALTSCFSNAQTNQYDESFWAGKLTLMQTPTEQLEEGLLTYYPINYQFSEGGTGTKYEQTYNNLSVQRTFDYEIEENGSISISNIELFRNFPSYNSSFLRRAERLWGREVAEEIRRMETNGPCSTASGQWEVHTGVSEETVEITQASKGSFLVDLTQTSSEVLVVPEWMLDAPCNWGAEPVPTYEEIKESENLELVYDTESLFSELQTEYFVGSWSLPIWYKVPHGDDITQSSFIEMNQDRVTFTSESAQAENSGKTFSWSLDAGVLILENGQERYEYTANSSNGNYHSVTVKYFEEQELVELLSGEIAKFAEIAPDTVQLYSFIRQEYPMVMGATIGRRKATDYINGTSRCPEAGYFGFAFLTDGRVAPRSFCGEYYQDNAFVDIYYNLMPQDSNSYQYNSETLTLEVTEDSGIRLDKRIWQIVDILNDKDLLVMESRIQNRDNNFNGEFEDSENIYITQPRLQIYRKMDLSQNTEVWQNTDSDSDGLSNAEETELGTDIISADTDGDGIPDGDEVANGTNPLRDENASFTAFDYDGDGEADVAVRRPSNSMQYILNSSDEAIQRVKFGLQEGDIPVSGDFDGDGTADVAVRRPSNFTWYVLNSSNSEIQRIRFGLQEADIPVPADYDGDGITDVAVRRPSNQTWYILNSTDGEIQRIRFGLQEADIPVPADYDGDGKADVAVRRPSNQMWYVLNSSDGETQRIKFGLQENDIPVPADYDGDGKADVAVRRPSNQMWYILNSSDSETQRIRFGLQESDIPVVADYDGDGKADVAVRRASNHMQYILRSSDEMIERIQFGRQNTDIPFAAPVSIRLQMLQDNVDASTQNGLAIEPELKKRELVKIEDY